MSTSSNDDSTNERPRGHVHLATSADSPTDQHVLAGILESVNDLFAALDTDLRLIIFNEAFQREFNELFGQCPALGQSLLEVLPRDQEKRLFQHAAERAFRGEMLSIIQEFIGRRGPTKVYKINFIPISNTDNQIVSVAIVARDVTAVREAEEKFHALLEASPDAMLITRKGVIEYVNAQAEELFGYPHNALLGKSVEQLVPQDVRTRHARDRAAYENMPKTRPMGIGMVLHGVRADGKQFPVEISLSPSVVAGQTVVISAVRDITGRKKVGEKLRKEVAALKAAATQMQAELHDQHRHERQVAHTSEQYRTVFEEGAAGIAVSATDGRFVQVNHALCAMMGYTREELLQLTIHDITHVDDLEIDSVLDASLLAGHRSSYSMEKRLLHKNGAVVWVALSASLKRDAQGAPQNFVFVIVDVTHRKEAEQRLSSAHLRMKIATEMGRLGYWEYDPKTQETYFSPEWKEQLGYADEELPSAVEEWNARLHPDDRARILERYQHFIEQHLGELHVEYRMRHRDGHYRWFKTRVIALEEVPGKVSKIIGIRLDITDSKESEEAIRLQAQYDPLTGLPNRALLHEYAEHIVATAKRNGIKGAFAFIDLDRFKDVNDSYGHDAGDEVLRRVAKRLRASIRKGDIAGRLGGDEFLVLFSQVSDASHAQAIAEKILVRLNKPHTFGGVQLHCTPSIGVALFPDKEDDVNTLMRKADDAMYVAKERGRGRVEMYTPELAQRTNAAQAVESRLKEAFQQSEFELYFQPIVNAHDAHIVGAEALLRWRPGPRKVLPPSEFISVAESIGVIDQLGAWAMRAACAQQARWSGRDKPFLRIAVNISPVQFRQRNLVAMIEEAIRQCVVDPAYIQVEIAESTITQDIERAAAVLSAIRDVGARTAIDHFGLGGGGLGNLLQLPIDTLKLDLAFIHRLQQKGGGADAAKWAIALYHSLHLEIVAAGIESESALHEARALDCDLVQGFGIGKPMRVLAFERWCARQGQ